MYPKTLRWFLLFSISGITSSWSSETLSEKIREAVLSIRFDQVVDFGPLENYCPGASFCSQPARQIADTPNLDIAVLAWDPQSPEPLTAHVVFSRDFPQGQIVNQDAHRSSIGIRFRRWDITRWNGGTYDTNTGKLILPKGWKTLPPLTSEDDVIAASEPNSPDFMSPYPASSFKLLVAFFYMRLVDQNRIQLGDFEDDLDKMITRSDNEATQRLLRWLHLHHEIAALNLELQSLGLKTLQINGTSPDKIQWTPGQIHMTAWDTVRLLGLIDGDARLSWTTQESRVVRAETILSSNSRAFLKKLLAEQAYHEALSTGSLCGITNWSEGIPAVFPNRWISPSTGLIETPARAQGRNPASCNAVASTEFLHKSGLTYNYASDVGIVRDRASQQTRYIVAWFSNLGYRYSDPAWANGKLLPCFTSDLRLCVTQKAGALGMKLDQIINGVLRKHVHPDPKNQSKPTSAPKG